MTKQKDDDDNVFISQLYLVVALRYSPPPPKGEPMAKVQPVPRTMGGHDDDDYYYYHDWDKCTTGITGLWQPSVHSDVAF